MTARDPSDRAIDAIAYPPALEQAEASMVAERRARAGHAPPEQPPTRLPTDAIGIGMSGGGVRRATFALGIFQAIASAQSLDKIDFISTVSGGGYFGSFLGRLFTRDWITSVDDVEHVLVGAASMNRTFGLVLGLVFGSISTARMFMGPSALVAPLLGANTALAVVMCILPRLLIPLVSHLSYQKLLNSRFIKLAPAISSALPAGQD